MNLRHLTDETLLKDTKSLVAQERELVHKILEHLREIERRRLFSSLGFQSLFDYATRGLGYSEAQAHVRISAMRLSRELPELGEKIQKGEVSLTNVAKVASFIKQQNKQLHVPMPVAEKRELVSKIENKSKREVEKILLNISPTAATPQEIVKPVTEELTQVSLLVDQQTLDMIKQLKGQLVHTHGAVSTGELLKILCKSHLTQTSFARAKSKRVKLVMEKAGYKCENCYSTFALEVDHVMPKALGGKDEPGNLRLLCRNCNQRSAVEKIGDQVSGFWS